MIDSQGTNVYKSPKLPWRCGECVRENVDRQLALEEAEVIAKESVA
jgi:hypothetical protein